MSIRSASPPAPTAWSARARTTTATTAYRLRDLARAAGVTTRTVRFYVTRGLLPAPTFRGASTTYGEEHLQRLRAIARLRDEERLRLDAIRRRLAQMDPAELAVLAAPRATDAPKSATPTASTISTRVEPPRSGSAERWDRIALLPGMELHVRADASPVVRRLSEEIHARYGASAGGAPGEMSSGAV